MMRKWSGRVGVAAMAVAALLAPGAAHAQGKIKVALMDFDNNAERSWWFYDQLGPAARNQIDTAFSENGELSKRFSVIEREKLALVMKEQGLATTGAVDPQSAAKVGRILGVKYIVTGGVDKVAVNKTAGGLAKFGGLGGSMVSADAAINMRFIDTTTAERVLSVSAEGTVKKGGGFFKGASLSRDAEWGLASEALEKASAAVVDKLLTGGYLDRINTAAGGSGVEGKIIKIEGTRAWVNLGTSAGLKVGDKFTVIDAGEDLVDPDTGVKLGSTEKTTGAAEVVEVQEKFAIVSFTGTAKPKDIVRK
jgi:curli biogenesis system outer membrane secretion channel CsgG